MNKDNRQNNVNQNGGREHEHPHGESLPHLPEPQYAADHKHGEKSQGRPGQANFIPGEAPVGEPGRTKPFKTTK